MFTHMSSQMAASSKDNEKANASIMKGEEIKVEPKFLHRMLEEKIVEGSYQNKVAIIYEDESNSKPSLKYQELNENANQFANGILDILKDQISTGKAKPNQDGDWIIAICMNRSDILVTCLLAIWKAGAAYMPIDVEYPQNRVEHILNEAKPVLVIYDDAYPNVNYFSNVTAVKYSDLRRVSQMKENIENIPDDRTLTKGSPSTNAFIIYTSGSTGTPKGVRIRHHTFTHRVMWQLRTYPYADTEHYCVTKTALIFLEHVPEMWCPLFAGKSLVIVPKAVVVNPEKFVPILEEYDVQRLLGVPTLLQSVLMYLKMNGTKSKLQKLKMWISSGEPLPLQLAQEFFEYFDDDSHKLINLYGCTEINSEVTYYSMESKKQLESLDRIPLGKVFPNTIMYVLDTNMKPVDEGVVGEIYCAGVSVVSGYLAGREPGAFLTNPMEKDEPYNRMYKTGDFGMMKDGLLFYEGRRDTQIKIRGHRIDLAEVEKNVNELEYVLKSEILVYHSGQHDQALLAFTSLKEKSETSASNVEKDLKNRLVFYMIPYVIVLENFPFLPNGKIDRQSLIKMYVEKISSMNASLSGKMDLSNVPKEKLSTTKQVFEIIGRSLGAELRSDLSTKSNFFELGGNSLNSIYTVMKLRDAGLFIGLADFLKARDIGEILDKMTSSSLTGVDESQDLISESNLKLLSEPINAFEQNKSIVLLAESFRSKNDLDKFLPGLKVEHYLETLSNLWKDAVEKGLSFMVKTDEGALVGVSLNFDIEDEEEIITETPLKTTIDFLESIEKPIIKNKLKPSGTGQILHAFMMGTAENLNTKQNIGVMTFMESEVIKMAKEKGFKGIFANNTNPLTHQLCVNIFGFETLSEVQINKFTDQKGERPYKEASDAVKSVMMYKDLTK